MPYQRKKEKCSKSFTVGIKQETTHLLTLMVGVWSLCLFSIFIQSLFTVTGNVLLEPNNREAIPELTVKQQQI